MRLGLGFEWNEKELLILENGGDEEGNEGS